MKPISTPDMKVGHLTEPIIMGNALRLRESNQTIYSLIFVCQTGLVKNIKHEHLHASPDYVGLAKIHGLVTPVFVEVKC